jgi:hypothetical protein
MDMIHRDIYEQKNEERWSRRLLQVDLYRERRGSRKLCDARTFDALMMTENTEKI